MKKLLAAVLVLASALTVAGTVTVPRWVGAAMGDGAAPQARRIYVLMIFTGRASLGEPEGTVVGAFTDDYRCARAADVLNSQETRRRNDGKPPWVCVEADVVKFQ